ncbi:MAG: TolC family protein [bacterium]
MTKNRNLLRIFLLFCFLVPLRLSALTLKECVNLAVSNNPALLLYREDIKISEFRVNQAKALMKPRMSLGAYYDYYNLGYPSIFSSSIGAFNLRPDSEELYGTRITLDQPLYTGGKNKTIKKQASHNLLSTQAQYLTEKNRIIYEVERKFIEVFYLKKMSAVISSAETSIAKADPGSLETEIGMQMEKEKINLDMELNKTLHELNSLVSAEFIESAQVADALVPDPTVLDGNLTKLILIAQQNRPELKGLKARESIDSLSVELGKSFKFPNVDFFSKYDYLHAIEDEWSSNFQVGVSLTFPLYDGGVRWSQYRERNALFQKTKILISSEEERIKSQVEQAYKGLEFSRKIFGLAQKRKDSFSIPSKSGVQDIKKWKEVMMDYLAAERDMLVASAFLKFSTGSEIPKY